MPSATPGRHAEHVMGTVVSFDLRDGATAPGALEDAVALLHGVDAVFSTYRWDSAVSRLDRGEIGLDRCPPEVREVLDLCAAEERASDGFFSVTARGRLDPSGLVKGWAVERASDLLGAAGSRVHSVNGGGDLQLVGRPADAHWRVGVVHPFAPGALVTVVSGADIAVATSGTAERGAHVVDPRTRRPARGLAAVTVVGPSLALADAHATAALAMGTQARDWLESLDGHEAFAVTDAGRCWWTGGFPAYGPVSG